ncbi:syntaxin-7 [Lepeophtheirus salmonis]|uniref:syntaxin-7 n=1 Tax=Lepeophtheirus salmonis TaxID=72036 RepID=UPI001AE788DC|nr:syntaxin-12-like [Lepeophtheirus salmonis]
MGDNNYNINNWQGGEDTKYRDVSGKLGLNIQKFIQNVSYLQKILGSTPIDGNFDKKLFSQMQEVITKNLELSKNINLQLSKIEGIASQYPLKERTLQIKSFRESYSTNLKNFKSLQETAIRKERENLSVFKSNEQRKQYPLLDLSSMEEHRGGDEESEEGRSGSMGGVRVHQQFENYKEIERLHEIEERRQAMVQLEGDIRDVNVIFKDLSLMINDQESLVNSIEDTVITTSANVNLAGGKIREAHAFQGAARKKRLFFYIFLIIALVALIGVMIWQFVPSAKPSHKIF